MSKTEIFIEKARKVHGDLYDYSKVVYVDCRTKIIIICKKHNEFKQTPSNHLSGNICKSCSIENRTLNNPYTIANFIETANKIYNNKYDYSKSVYINSKTNINIICKIHGVFSQRPDVHLSGSGCWDCGILIRTNSNKVSKEKFIERANIIHNNKYDYSKVDYIDTRTYINIICKIHGEFQQLVRNHLSGYGCKNCANEQSRYTNEEFIFKANIVHNNKYDYSNVNYINTHERIEIICNKHGIFYQVAQDHLRGCGCTKCLLCPLCQLWKTNGELCSYCKPKTISKKYFKTKEYAIVNFLKEQLPDNEFIHNKSVGKDCSNGHLFPDIRFDCNYYQLIVEVDEHKHRGADYKCDEQRMYDIVAKLGMPCIFIRYNPDNKQSDKNVLLSKVKEYLELNDEKEIWNEFGLYTEYLFY